MSPEVFKSLRPGDQIRWARDTDSMAIYTIVADHGTHLTAVSVVEITNPPEWVLVQKVENGPVYPQINGP